jgi:signal transduction histidine kinase
VEIVREIAVTVDDYVKRKGITLSFYTEVKEKMITCDVDKVERILLNMLSNAIKFTDEGGRISIF